VIVIAIVDILFLFGSSQRAAFGWDMGIGWHGWRCWGLKVAFSCTGSLDYTQDTVIGKEDSG
jgi:hypothetical protein